MYSQLQQLLFKACRQEEFESELSSVCSFYKNNFQQDVLRAQLLTLCIHVSSEQQTSVTIFDVKDYFLSLSFAQRSLLSEVSLLLQLVLVLPATNATSERSFSALRRVKTYLRTTMHQERLNSLLVLHVHKELTDALDLIATAVYLHTRMHT